MGELMDRLNLHYIYIICYLIYIYIQYIDCAKSVLSVTSWESFSFPLSLGAAAWGVPFFRLKQELDVAVYRNSSATDQLKQRSKCHTGFVCIV